MPVAIQTPFHEQRGMLPNQRHAIHSPVAGATADSFVHMNAMVEVGEVRQIVHPSPSNGSVRPVAFAHWLEHWARRPNLRMAVHAGFRRRNSGGSCNLHRCVAVTAVNTDSGYMVLMAEWDGLLPCHSCLGHISRAVDHDNHCENAGDDED